MTCRMRGVDWVTTLSSSLVGLILFVSACTSPEPPATSATRDSAGVNIVESPVPAWPEGTGWRIGEAITTIGEFEGEEEYQLYQAFGGLVMNSGEIVIANAGTHELRFYDQSGAFVRSSGREGEGPGEFSGFMRIYRMPGDSVGTWDFRQRRFSVFGPEGSFARSVNIEVGNVSNMVGVFSDGSFVTSPASMFGPNNEISDGYHRDDKVYLHVGVDGDSLGVIGEFRGTEYFFKSFDRGATMSSLLLGKNTVTAIRGNELFVGTADDFSVAVVTAGGTLERIVRRPYEPQPVSRSLFDDAVSQRLEGTEERFRSSQSSLYDDMEPPEVLPAYATIRTDPQGNLWVLHYGRPDQQDSPRTWSVFGSDGVWLGEVTTPADLSIFDIGDDYILGRFTDDLDVEHVALYELLKS